MSSRTAKILALAAAAPSTSSLTEISEKSNERNITNETASEGELNKCNTVQKRLEPILRFDESVGPHTFDDIPIVFEDILIDTSLSEYMVIDDSSMRSNNIIQIEQSSLKESLPAQVKWRNCTNRFNAPNIQISG